MDGDSPLVQAARDDRSGRVGEQGQLIEGVFMLQRRRETDEDGPLRRRRVAGRRLARARGFLREDLVSLFRLPGEPRGRERRGAVR